jgi:importin subunit beta-1
MLCFSADVNLIQPHVGHVMSFIEHIALDEDHSDENVAAACGLIGSVCKTS